MNRTTLAVFAALGLLLLGDIARADSEDEIYAIKKCIRQHRNPKTSVNSGTVTLVYYCDGFTARMVKAIQKADTDEVLGSLFAGSQSTLECKDYKDYCEVTVTRPR